MGTCTHRVQQVVERIQLIVLVDYRDMYTESTTGSIDSTADCRLRGHAHRYIFIRKSVPDDIASSFKVREDDLSSKQG